MQPRRAFFKGNQYLKIMGAKRPSAARWCERIWTVIATAAIQAKSAFKYLVGAITAHSEGRVVPSLVNSS